MNSEKRLDKDIIEDLKFISQTNRSLHEQRIADEIKIVITTITLYVLSVGAKISAGNKFPENCSFNTCVWFVFLILPIAVSFYLIGSDRANNINQKTAETAEDEIIAFIKKNNIDFPNMRGKHPNKHRVWLYIFVIFLVAIVSAIIITIM